MDRFWCGGARDGAWHHHQDDARQVVAVSSPRTQNNRQLVWKSTLTACGKGVETPVGSEHSTSIECWQGKQSTCCGCYTFCVGTAYRWFACFEITEVLFFKFVQQASPAGKSTAREHFFFSSERLLLPTSVGLPFSAPGLSRNRLETVFRTTPPPAWCLG